MQKEKKKIFNLLLDAGQQSLMADLGKKIGSLGLPNRDIEKMFKETCKASGITSGKVHIRLEVFTDKTFTLVVHKQPGTSTLILQELGLKSGSNKVGHNAIIATLSAEQLRKIALKKMTDMGMNNDTKSLSFEQNVVAAEKTVAGTAKSMGIAIANSNKGGK